MIDYPMFNSMPQRPFLPISDFNGPLQTLDTPLREQYKYSICLLIHIIRDYCLSAAVSVGFFNGLQEYSSPCRHLQNFTLTFGIFCTLYLDFCGIRLSCPWMLQGV